MSVCLSQYHNVCLSVSVSVHVCLSVPESVHVCLSVPVSVHVCLSVCASICSCLSVCLCQYLFMSVCLSVPVSVCLPVCPNICYCLSVCLSQYLFCVHSMFALLSQTQALLQYYSLIVTRNDSLFCCVAMCWLGFAMFNDVSCLCFLYILRNFIPTHFHRQSFTVLTTKKKRKSRKRHDWMNSETGWIRIKKTFQRNFV
jgi:hypothetical protein